VSDPNSTNIVTDIEKEQTNALLLDYINTKLAPREREVIKDYFGFYGVRTQSKDLAIQMGVSKELIRHIRLKAIGKLKNALIAQKNDLSY